MRSTGVAIFALVAVTAAACEPGPGDDGPRPAACRGDAVRIGIARADTGHLTVAFAVIVSDQRTDVPAASGPGELRVLDAGGGLLAAAPVPELGPVSSIAPDPAEGGAAAGGVAAITLPWPAGAVAIELDGDVFTRVTCGDSGADGKADAAAIESWVSGPSSQRFDLVILGDGYAAHERAAFAADAGAVTSHLLSTEPYRSYRHLVNVWHVPADSVASGAGDGPGDVADTAYRCYFGHGGVERALWCDLGRVQRAASAVPGYDGVLVIVNDPRSGGSGSSVLATTSNAALMRETAIHELGHQLGLRDEYVYAGGEPTAGVGPNCAADPAAPAWAHWRDVPHIGAFPGCSSPAWYRPTQEACLMRYLHADGYCEVCREHVVRALHRASRRADRASPDASSIAELPVELDVSDVGAGDVRHAWTLGGREVDTDAATIALEQCAGGSATARVHDETPWVRLDPEGDLVESVQWALRCEGGALHELPPSAVCGVIASVPDQPCAAQATAVAVASGPDEQHAYLRFDLEPVRGKRVVSATLWLSQVPAVSLPGAPPVHEVARVAHDDWGQASWATRPAVVDDGGAAMLVLPGERLALDVTAWAAAEASGDGQLSLRVAARPTAGAAVRLYASTLDADPSLRPRLVIETAVDGDTAEDAHYVSVDTPLSIPDDDATGVTSTIAVAGVGSADATVEVDIAHPYRADLRVVLTCPDGATAVLHDRQGGGADDLRSSYAVPVCTGTGPWTLTVSDLAPADEGVLERWAVRLRAR